jgi:hypothetical protein
MDDALEKLIAAGPWPQRTGLKTLVNLALRPRGRKLLSYSPPAEQAALSLIALTRYDDPAIAQQLGWDAAQVVARGRALRRREGRP